MNILFSSSKYNIATTSDTNNAQIDNWNSLSRLTSRVRKRQHQNMRGLRIIFLRKNMAAHIKSINSLPSLFFLHTHTNTHTFMYILEHMPAHFLNMQYTITTIILNIYLYSINYHSQSQTLISEYKLRFIQKEATTTTKRGRANWNNTT